MSANATNDGRRILVVDDNPAAAEITASLLSAAGTQFDLARDGFEAIMRLQSQTYATVLLDYVMPGMDGAEVMGWISRRIATPPRVYVVSSEDPDVLQRRFRGLGVAGFMAKPLSAATLSRALAA